jgi:hypothetical protein
MNITRTSPITGKTHTLDLAVTQAQLDTYARGGVMIQQAFPDLSKEDREFIKTGITPEEWDTMFAGLDE